MARSSDPAAVVDEAEAMRREGRVHDALQAVEEFLHARPDHSRALLLRNRLLYETGSVVEAMVGLRALARLVESEELQPLVAALEQLRDSRKPAFVTESMASLLTEQGYFLEALEVYRQLFHAAPDRGDLCDEIVRIKAIVEQEGSRGAAKDKVKRELEVWERRLRENQRES